MKALHALLVYSKRESNKQNIIKSIKLLYAANSVKLWMDHQRLGLRATSCFLLVQAQRVHRKAHLPSDTSPPQAPVL